MSNKFKVGDRVHFAKCVLGKSPVVGGVISSVTSGANSVYTIDTNDSLGLYVRFEWEISLDIAAHLVLAAEETIDDV